MASLLAVLGAAGLMHEAGHVIIAKQFGHVFQNYPHSDDNVKAVWLEENGIGFTWLKDFPEQLKPSHRLRAHRIQTLAGPIAECLMWAIQRGKWKSSGRCKSKNEKESSGR